jgi:methylphosphotriester-DNA--protein-cysteine methyltransferase
MQQDELTTRLWRALLEIHGGKDVERMIVAHFEHSRTLDDIAREHSISKATVHRRIARLRATLARHGILPLAWQQRDRLRRHVSHTRNTTCIRDGELNNGK